MRGIRRMLSVGVGCLVGIFVLSFVILRSGMTRESVGKVLRGSRGKTAPSITLLVWDWWSPAGNEQYGSYFDDLERVFEQRNPDVDVVYQFVPFGYYVQKLSTAMVGHRPPDVFQSSVYWAEGFYHRGMLRPLNDLLAAESSAPSQERVSGEAFMPSAWHHNHTQDGVVYGIPQIIDANCLLWNLDILQEESQDDEEIRDLFARKEDGSIDFDRIRFDAIRDWEHFRRITKKLTKVGENGEVERAGFVIHAYGGGSGILSPWLVSNGGSYQDSAGTRALFDSQNGIQTMEFLSRLYWEDRVSPTFRRQLSSQELFEEHGVAVVVAGTWTGKDVMRDTQGWGHFGKTAFPPGPMGNGQKSECWGNMLVITQSCQRLEAAWRYIKFVCGLEGNRLRSKHLGYNGPRFDFYNTQEWQTAIQERPYLSNVKEICLAGEKLRHTEIIAADHQADPVFEAILLNYPEIKAGRGTFPSVQAALEEAARNVNAVYDRYNQQVSSWAEARDDREGSPPSEGGSR